MNICKIQGDRSDVGLVLMVLVDSSLMQKVVCPSRKNQIKIDAVLLK